MKVIPSAGHSGWIVITTNGDEFTLTERDENTVIILNHVSGVRQQFDGNLAQAIGYLSAKETAHSNG